MRTRAIAALVFATLSALTVAPIAQAQTTTSCAQSAAGGEWRLYGHDYNNSRNQDQETTIGRLQAPTLTPIWSFSSNGNGDFTGTPVVADGCVFVGSNGGGVYALNADTGAQVWKTQVIPSSSGGINSSLAVVGGMVFVNVSQKNAPFVAALDESTGNLRHTSAPLDTQTGADLYSSPVIYQGLVFVGVSGGAAELTPGSERSSFHGNFVVLKESDLSLVTKTYTIPLTDTVHAGASIWSTPAIDTATGMAYLGTGNPFTLADDSTVPTDSILKIDLNCMQGTTGACTNSNLGKIVSYYKGTVDTYSTALNGIPCIPFQSNPVAYPQGVGNCQQIDLDFGASPNLFTVGSQQLVGDGQKSGVYHAVDRSAMTGVWQTIIGPPSSVGGIVSSAAFDGSSIYGGETLAGYLFALADDTGLPQWIGPTADAVHWAEPVAYANGVVYTVDLAGFLDAFDAATGALLLKRPMALGSNTGFNPVLSWGGVSVARNTVYAGVGLSALPTGFIIAYQPLALPPPLP